jgi:hypothetical protein
MNFDYVIIGSGPAGSILAWKLAQLKFNIAIIDRSNSKKKTINDFFLPYVRYSPNYYTPVFSNQLGGNSLLWHNKIYLLSQKEFNLNQWPFNYSELLENSRELSKLLNINDSTALEKIEKEKNSKFDYHYSQRCKIGNIFDYLELSKISNIKIFENSSPVKINYDQDHNANSVFIKNLRSQNDIELQINKSLIFCAGGIGNPHLVLNLIPDNNKNTGKFLSDHPHVNIQKINSKEFSNYKKIFKPNIKNNIKGISEQEKKIEVAAVYQIKNILAGIQLDYKKDPMRYLRRFFLKIPFNNVRKFLNIFSYILTKLNGFFIKLGLFFGNYYQYSFEFFFSQSQDINNKVFLDEKSTDKFGLKKVNISWQISLNDQQKYNKIIDSLLGENGFIKKNNMESNFIKNFEKSGLAGLHPSCTTMMGSDKEKSVVDKNLKIYGMQNIFICGSSVFPINGITNPTWTIMTLANRLSKHLVKI